jgi:hypothetical protein
MTPLPRTARCRSCSEPIMFVIGPKGTHLPVEVRPSASGNVVLAHDGKHWNAGGAHTRSRRPALARMGKTPTSLTSPPAVRPRPTASGHSAPPSKLGASDDESNRTER